MRVHAKLCWNGDAARACLRTHDLPPTSRTLRHLKAKFLPYLTCTGLLKDERALLVSAIIANKGNATPLFQFAVLYAQDLMPLIVQLLYFFSLNNGLVFRSQRLDSRLVIHHKFSHTHTSTSGAGVEDGVGLIRTSSQLLVVVDGP